MNELIQPNAGLFSTVLSDLEPSANELVLNTRGTFFKHQGQEVFAGRDHLGRPHLLVPVSDLGILDSEHQPAKGLKIKLTSFKTGNQEQFFLDILCLDSNADDIFGAICNEYCQSISDNGGDSILLGKFEVTIEKWREILKALVEREPSDNEICGLIGELWLLEAATLKIGVNAIDNWFGPDQARHDFEFPTRSIEVKTSRSTANKKITVHGVTQLDSKPGHYIDLVLFQTERTPSGDSVKVVLDRLIKLGVSDSKLNSKLSKFGENLAENAPGWTTTYKISAVATSVFPVDGEFPILKLSQLNEVQKNRISGIAYDLRLDGLKCRVMAGLKLEELGEILFS